MILELASFLGTSVGGRLFGMAGDWIAGRREAQREKAEFKHQRSLADKGAFTEYAKALSSPQSDGSYSPLQWVIAFVILLFAVTYCTATLTCFFDNPGEIIYTKDPSEDSREIALFFGAIKWDLANNRILAMSKAGMGFLMCYPLVFILSMVTTGDRPKRR